MLGKDIISLIVLEIDDSWTWINFSQVNKKCYQLCQKSLIKVEFPETRSRYKYTHHTLPCGKIHGKELVYMNNELIYSLFFLARSG